MKLFLTKEEYLEGRDEVIEEQLSSPTFYKVFKLLESRSGIESECFKRMFKNDFSAFMDEGFEKFRWLIRPLHALLLGAYASSKVIKKWS